MVFKGELLIYRNGEQLYFAMGRSPRITIAEGDILVVQLKSWFVFRSFRMAFVSDDGLSILPFRCEHFRRVHGEPQTITAENVRQSTELPVRGRADPDHREMWLKLKLPADEAEWMWGPERDVWYQYACVIDREMVKSLAPASAEAGTATP